MEMGDMCISLSEVKPGFVPAAEALNRNGDDKVCKSENPRISDKDFEDFVYLIKASPSVEVKEISPKAGAQKIEIPEMIKLSDKVSIMKEEVTVGLFKQVMQGYKITGNNADKLIALLADDSKTWEAYSKTWEALTRVNLDDAREFAKRLSEQTGRKFRVQTEAEWLQAGIQLRGYNNTWTETKNKRVSNQFVFRRLGDGGWSDNCLMPWERQNDTAIRLVEDK